jgi:hypothetical protein
VVVGALQHSLRLWNGYIDPPQLVCETKSFLKDCHDLAELMPRSGTGQALV